MTTYTHDTVPTQFVEANGIRFAYRRFGKTGGVPIVMNIHFRGTMDHWDPAITDGLARDREVILFDNAGIGASSGQTPASIPAMATDAIAFIKALGISKADILGYSVGGKVAQEIVVQAPDLVRKLILVGTGPRGADTAASKSAEIFSATYDPPEHLWIAAHFLPNAAGHAAGLKYLERKFRRQDRGPEVSEAVRCRAVRGDRQVQREDRRRVGLSGGHPSSGARRRWQQRPDHPHDQRLHVAAAPAERAAHRLSGFQPRAVLPVSGAVPGSRCPVPGCVTRAEVCEPIGRVPAVDRLASRSPIGRSIMTPCSGKTALVTGASRGIGRAAAIALAKAGAQVLVHYGRNAAEATSVVDQIKAAGGRAEAVGPTCPTPRRP